MNEDVMVVETAALHPYLTGDFIREHTQHIFDLIAAAHRFIPRAVAEVSPQWRQIIPYVVLRHSDDYFLLTRTSKQNEARLHHKRSLGIGGHINPGHTLRSGLQQELDEEVDVPVPYELQFAGFINDDTTDVGRVHFGAAFLLNVKAKEVRVKETEKMFGEWLPQSALRDSRGAMESWSQIVYDHLLA